MGEVTGDFLYDHIVEESAGEGAGISARRTHHQLRATLKGHVSAEGRLENVDIDANITLSLEATDRASTQRRTRMLARFAPVRGSSPAPTDIKFQNSWKWDAPGDDMADGKTAGDLFRIAMTLSSQSYLVAETEWSKPNTCVEIKFEPGTLTQAFVEGRRYEVVAELRTKEGSQAVSARTDDVLELQVTNNGSVTPKKVEWAAEGSAKFEYRAPSAPKRASGFRVARVRSRAGMADAEWLLSDAFKISIEHRIWDDTSTAYGAMGHALFSGTVKFDVVLTSPTQDALTVLRGESNVRRDLQVTHVTSKCRGAGFQDETWRIFASVEPETRTVQLHMGFIEEAAHATWQCTNDREPRELSVVLFNEVESVRMSALAGSTMEVSMRQGRENRNELLKVKILTSPVQSLP